MKKFNALNELSILREVLSFELSLIEKNLNDENVSRWKAVFESRIDELDKEILSLKIGKVNNINCDKARERLAKKVSKREISSNFNGAFVVDDTQQIIYKYYLAVYYNIMDGLVTASSPRPDMYDGRKLLTPGEKDRELSITIDLKELKSLSKIAKTDGVELCEQSIKINDQYFSVEYIIELLSTLSGNLKYSFATHGSSLGLRVDGDNGYIYLLPLRPKSILPQKYLLKTYEEGETK